MPPGIGYGDGTTGLLEGLVGGFLMGHDFRTQREDRKVSAAERLRRQQLEDEERRVAASTRARAEAIQDVNLRAEHGLAYDPTTPSGASATPLTRAVQTAYNVPEGFRRVGPSASERRATELANIRRSAGQFLMASPEERRTMFGDPNVLAGLGEVGVDIDAYLDRTIPKPLTATVSGDGVSVPNVPLDQIPTIRGQIPQKPPEGGFDTTNAIADDFRVEAADAEAIGKAVAQARSAGDNSIGDQTLVFSLNNILDPGVSVRQDDFVRYAEAGGLESRAARYWNMIGADGRLPANIREQLLAEIEGTGAINQQRFERVRERYRRMAEKFGVDFGLIDRDPFAAGGMFDDLVPQQ